ncbi:MAG: YbgA family protein [Gammaproteobacteria bacterium]
MNDHPLKIPVGISSCLVGEKVRYDGGHKNNDFIRLTLGRYFEFRPFCPEVESGMGVPRPPVQLRYTENGVRCVGVRDPQFDATDTLLACSERQRSWLEDMCGYILKKDSPSCGMERVKVYKNDYAERTGSGVFAQFLKDRFVLMPIEEEGRLGDPLLRENFIQRVYVYYRWRRLLAGKLDTNGLTRFHARHKLIVMSRDPKLARELGRLAATAGKNDIETIAWRYATLLMRTLAIIATRGNHTNVLQHIQGYLKKSLDADDKAELVDVIERYRLGQIPLIVPITLLKHHFRKQPDAFIEQSYYLTPYPEELTLLNDI